MQHQLDLGLSILSKTAIILFSAILLTGIGLASDDKVAATEGPLLTNADQAGDFGVHLHDYDAEDREGVVIATSHDETTSDFATSTVDISSQDLTIGDFEGENAPQISYDYKALGDHTNAYPDEAWLYVKDEGGELDQLFLTSRQNENSDIEKYNWHTRDLTKDIKGDGRDWRELESAENYPAVGSDLTEEYGSDAEVVAVGFGVGNQEGDVQEILFDDLVVGEETYDFETPEKNLVDADSRTVNHQTIQSAVDDAEEGDTIEVAEGTYEEKVTIETSGITLESVGDTESTIISADAEEGVMIKASDVTVRGFTVTTNLDDTDTHGQYGIRLEPPSSSVEDILIEDNIVEDISDTYRPSGISLDMKETADKTATNITVRDNIIRNIAGVESEYEAVAKAINPNERFVDLVIKDNKIRNIGNEHSAGASAIDMSSDTGVDPNVGPKDFTITGNDIDGITIGEDVDTVWKDEIALYLHAYGDLGNHKVANNQFEDGRVIYNTEGVENPDTLDATHNYWGQPTGPEDSQISGDVEWRPYFPTEQALENSNAFERYENFLSSFDNVDENSERSDSEIRSIAQDVASSVPTMNDAEVRSIVESEVEGFVTESEFESELDSREETIEEQEQTIEEQEERIDELESEVESLNDQMNQTLEVLEESGQAEVDRGPTGQFTVTSPEEENNQPGIGGLFSGIFG